MDRRGIAPAPPHGRWSPWAKPVLFAHIDAVEGLPHIDIPEIRLPIDRAKAGGTALVVDLPGLESVGLGLELARRGYRPVPPFNACPNPAIPGRGRARGRPGDAVAAGLGASGRTPETDRSPRGFRSRLLARREPPGRGKATVLVVWTTAGSSSRPTWFSASLSGTRSPPSS